MAEIMLAIQTTMPRRIKFLRLMCTGCSDECLPSTYASMAMMVCREAGGTVEASEGEVYSFLYILSNCATPFSKPIICVIINGYISNIKIAYFSFEERRYRGGVCNLHCVNG